MKNNTKKSKRNKCEHVFRIIGQDVIKDIYALLNDTISYEYKGYHLKNRMCLKCRLSTTVAVYGLVEYNLIDKLFIGRKYHHIEDNNLLYYDVIDSKTLQKIKFKE